MTPPPPAKRLEFLDAGRGVAALAVVIYHFTGYSARLGDIYQHTFAPGVFGVVVFFLISGYIIPASLQRHRTLTDFWKSRFFRIMPMYWASLVAALALFYAGIMPLDQDFRQHLALHAVENFFMIALTIHAPIVLGTYWTLTVEMYFYLLCSLLRRTGMLANRTTILFCGIVLLFLVQVLCALGHIPPKDTRPYWQGVLLIACLGSLIYDHSRGIASKAKLYLFVPLTLVPILTGAWQLIQTSRPAGEPDFTAITTAYLAGVGFFLILYKLRNARFPYALLWLGRISYSLYLVHSVILPAVQAFVRPNWLAAPLALVATVATADLTYRFIERPALKLAGDTHRADRTSFAVPIATKAS